MSLVKYDPWRSLEKAEREMFNFFEDFKLGFPVATSFDLNSYSPRVDTAEDEKNLYITAELPGMAKEDVKVSIVDGALTIKGKKERKQETKDKNYHRIERSFGEFVRQFGLPKEGYKKELISANFADGVLEITIPKDETKTARADEVPIPISMGNSKK